MVFVDVVVVGCFVLNLLMMNFLPHPAVEDVALPSYLHTFCHLFFQYFQYRILLNFLMLAGTHLQKIVVGYLNQRKKTNATLTHIGLLHAYDHRADNADYTAFVHSL